MSDKDENGVDKKFKPLQEDLLAIDESFPIDGLPFSEVKRNWVNEHLTPFEKYPDVMLYTRKYRPFAGHEAGKKKPVTEIDKDRESGHKCLFGDTDGNHDALFARLNAELDNEH